MRAGMHQNTASKYLKSGKLPSEERRARDWRTRKDPFEEDWAEIEAMLEQSPGLEATALFEYVQSIHGSKYSDGQLRTFQRRVKRWRATKGPDREIFFPQKHRPGEAAQTDFTWGSSLAITIAGVPYKHMLCVTTLP